MTLKPVLDRVLVKPEDDEGVTLAGVQIEIAGSHKKRPDRGVVVAVGPGRDEGTRTCAAGDTILYGKMAGDDVKDGDEEYVAIRFSDVIAVIEDE